MMAVSTNPWISVQLPEEHKRYLEIKAGLEGCTRSELLRRIITTDAEAKKNRNIMTMVRERSS